MIPVLPISQAGMYNCFYDLCLHRSKIDERLLFKLGYLSEDRINGCDQKISYGGAPVGGGREKGVVQTRLFTMNQLSWPYIDLYKALDLQNFNHS